MTEDNSPKKNKRELNNGSLKKKYRKPSLETYGLVKNLTQSTGSANGDGGQSMMT